MFCWCYSAFLVPLHSGNDEQLQNSLPELMPFFATRFIIGLPHLGHKGASDCMHFFSENASLSVITLSVNLDI